MPYQAPTPGGGLHRWRWRVITGAGGGLASGEAVVMKVGPPVLTPLP